MPSVAASIGGIRGYRLRLNPARNVVLSLDETVLRELPFLGRRPMVAGSLSSTGCRLKSVYPATIQALAKTTKRTFRVEPE